jgi:hypothetical protein
MVPVCQCSSTRPVHSHRSNSVGLLGRGLVGQREDGGLAVGLVAVEAHAFAGFFT